MERRDGPNAEQLIDHAWMVDCALLLRHRPQALTAAERLFDDLALHERAVEPARRYLDASTAEALATSALALRAGVKLLAEELRSGTRWPLPALRSQVERLILEEAAAVADQAAAHVD